METLQIDKSNALKAHSEANSKGKSLLENLFGKKIFYKNIIERIFTLEDACHETGDDYTTIFDGIDDTVDQAEKAIKVFAKALREGKDASECIYYPYFYISGGGFSFLVYVCVNAYSHVGARLRVDSAEKATHLGKCMESFYKTYLTGK